MSEKQRYEILVIGSGEAGKYRAWTTAKPGPHSGRRARADWRGLPKHCLPAKQEHHSQRQGSGTGPPRFRVWDHDWPCDHRNGRRAAAQTQDGG